MKKMALLMILVTLGGIAGATERIPSTKPLCTTEQCGKKKNKNKCSCWCSVLCGPRKIQPDDKPILASEDSNGQEVPEQCYCKQMDVDKYNERCVKGAEAEATEEVVEEESAE